MLTNLRTRLLLSSIVTIGIVVGLLTFIIVERANLNSTVDKLYQLQRAAGQARELSLYVQYNAHDTNAYTLGHLDHRQEFVEHSASFTTILTELRAAIDAGLLDDDEIEILDQIAQTRSVYDEASRDLFAAADANRTTPSAANQANEDATWKRSDQLGDQLDEASQELARSIGQDVSRVQAELAQRNMQMIRLVSILGIILIAMIILIQWSAARAVGAPLQALLVGVKKVAAGDLDTQVAITRRDEVGTLAEAFNTMAARLRQQTAELQGQNSAAEAARLEAEAARVEAEAARADLAEQLATVEAQRAVIREMSVPVLPLSDNALVMPLVGALDSGRLNLVQEQALHSLSRSRARHLILDITGVPVIDTQVAQGLLGVVTAARLLGAEVVLVGIRPEVAQTLVGLGVQLGEVVTRSSLQDGISYALRR